MEPMQAATDNAIEVTGLTKLFGSVTAVRDLSFTIRRGAGTGFLGPNGAGETTTLRLILGLAPPSSGGATIFRPPHAGPRPPPGRARAPPGAARLSPRPAGAAPPPG